MQEPQGMSTDGHNNNKTQKKWFLIIVKDLNVACNRITRLTNAIGQLSCLNTLRVEGNELTELPATLGSLYKTLTVIQADVDKIVFPYREILEQGSAAVVEFLRFTLQSYVPSYR